MDLKADHEAVLADRVHLTNVIFNLIDNALKYTIENPLIVISTRNQNNGLVISVSDNGVGISKENKERIFEKFYRVPTGNVHDVKGFGLGLSYVKAITDMHHGEIHIESEVGKGSTFEIFLPQDNLFSPEENS
jgi:two-component system phosphate regulon sensor histidine kinase PhoR